MANTPRPLIQTICHVMKPDPRGKPDFTMSDPACGTGGFLVCAWEWLISKPVPDGVFDRSDYFIRKKVYHDQDLVPRPRRLALMNLFLHGVEPHIYLDNILACHWSRRICPLCPINRSLSYSVVRLPSRP